MTKKPPKYKILKLKLDPCQGAAALAASIDMPGYRFVSLVRKGVNATIKFERLP